MNLSHYRRLYRASHVPNLIELELYADAAFLMCQGMERVNQQVIGRKWGDGLDSYHLSIKLLQRKVERANSQLTKALQSAHQYHQRGLQIQFLRANDPEASEMAEIIFSILRILHHPRVNVDGQCVG